MLESLVTTSELGAVDGAFQLWNMIDARIGALQRNFQYVKKNGLISDVRLPKVEYQYYASLHELKEWRSQLDSTSLTSHTDVSEIRALLRSRGSVNDDLRSIFGGAVDGDKKSAGEPWVIEMLAKCKERGIAARINEHRFRLCEEIVHRVGQGWFVVFNTLTVEPYHYESVFARGSTAWKDYIRRVNRAVGTEIYGSVRRADVESRTNPFHSYFGVVESGGLRGRLHIHVVHCFRELPRAWRSDPNRGLRLPKNRQIPGMWSLWPHGFSVPRPVRFSDRDAFGLIGWRWPVVKPKGAKKYRVYEGRPPAALGSYLVKYLVKSYGDDRSAYQWRTRLSRNLGTSRLREALMRVTTESLITTLSIDARWLMIREQWIPRKRLRLETIRILLKRMRSERSESDGNTSREWRQQRSLMMLKARPPIVEQWRNTIRKERTFKRSRASNIEMPTLIRTAVSEVEECCVRVFVDEQERFRKV